MPPTPLSRLALLAALCPTLVSAAPPGTLSLSTPIQQTPGGAQAWTIRYWTTDERNQPIEVTGRVVAPREAAPAAPRKVLAWTHGTWGVTARCAPNDNDFFASTPGLTQAIARGFVVVAPDYPGLGSTMPHGYLSGIGTGRAVLDAVRAAGAISGAYAGKRFAVWGESQGGHAALWTGQLQRGYAPELSLAGVAAAAPPTDLARNLASGSDPSVRAFLTAFTADSWSRYFGAPLTTLGNRSTQGVITRLAQNNCVKLGAKPRLGTMLGVLVLRRDLRNVDLGRIAPWAGIARRNSPDAAPYGTPFLIAQNPDDVIVAPAVTRDFARRMCRSGGVVRYLTIRGKGHETSAADSTAETLDWIDARFAGTRAPSDCGRI